MIPKLYAPGTTDFTNNGLGFLSEAVSCEVTEERNGIFDTTLQYPYSGDKYRKLMIGSYVMTKASATTPNPQIFRVSKISRPINGIVTYSAEHIRYALNHYPVVPCAINKTHTSPYYALSALQTDSVINPGALGFKFAASGFSTGGSYTINMQPGVYSVGQVLAGTEGGILDACGGEYEFDNYNITLHKSRGRDTGHTITYGKNLVDIQQDIMDDAYTCVLPYMLFTNSDNVTDVLTISHNSPTEWKYPGANGSIITGHNPTRPTFDADIIKLENYDLYSAPRCYYLNLTDVITGVDAVPPVTKMRSYANAWISANKDELINNTVNTTVNFIDLSKTEEYKNFECLQSDGLCDTVRLKVPHMELDTKVKITKTVYDSLNERYISMDLGTIKTTLSSMVAGQTQLVRRVRNEVSALPSYIQSLSAILGGTK